MKNFLSKLGAAISGPEFLSDQYLCEPSIAAGRFSLALREARDFYEKHKQREISPELIHESWLHNIKALEAYFARQMNVDFMSNEVINGTMVFTNREAHRLELKNISSAFDKQIAAGLISKGLNAAFLSGKSRRSTLINSTHHLHHLMRFEQCTGRKIGGIGSVVEFGGGYGNMARIVQNFGACCRYSIIDLLLFSCIQYVFLGTVAGNDHVAFDDGNLKDDAKFLLHPLFRADAQTDLRGELFISTWALSESTPAAYEWVVAHDWFGSNSLLLAYNEHWKPWSENSLEVSLTESGWRVVQEAIPFLPGSFYLFATR
jgi:hypothetical protein